MDVLLTVAITFVVSLALAYLFFSAELKREKKRLKREYNALLRAGEKSQSESEHILATIDIGILYYNAAGDLSSKNPAATDLLPVIPQSFRDFLDQYGNLNGMAAQLALGKDFVSAVLQLDDHMTYISVQLVGKGDKTGRVVLARDATRQFKEETQRNQYVSNVSHELRTPLTTIKTYSESLIDWGIQEKQRSQIIKDVTKIYEESEHMEQLINDLSLLSNLDERTIGSRSHIEPLDPATVVKSLVERMQIQAHEQGIILEAFAVSQVPRIYCDRTQLERILTNLITNAIKYSNEPGHVTVYIGSVREEAYIKVKDDGIGIDSQHLEHIFERFYRVDDSRARQSGGRGLGLAIVKELVELNEGTISVTSALTRGSEFTIMFPSEQKTLRQCLYQLCHESTELSYVGKAAESDLIELAQSLGIMAKWKSLEQQDYERLLSAINKV